jgi:hypothetical protein
MHKIYKNLKFNVASLSCARHASQALWASTLGRWLAGGPVFAVRQPDAAHDKGWVGPHVSQPLWASSTDLWLAGGPVFAVRQPHVAHGKGWVGPHVSQPLWASSTDQWLAGEGRAGAGDGVQEACARHALRGASLVRHKLLRCKVGKEDDQRRSKNLYADPGAIRGGKIAFPLFGHRLI